MAQSYASLDRLARSHAIPWLRTEWPKLLVAAVSVLALVDYAGRSAREITTDDPAELQVTTLAAGIPHGTSYPLYVWLLRVFIRLPLGPIALRFNLFSGVCAALALGALAFTVAYSYDPEERRTGMLAGAFAAALFALSRTFTEVAIFTGMYTLHAVLAFVVLGLVARWSRTRHGRDLEVALLLLGAMFSNHIMTLALLPGLGVAIAWTLAKDRSQWRPLLRGILWGACMLAACDLFLFFLLWRNHVPFDHWAQIRSCPKFFEIPAGKATSFWYAWWYETTCRQFRFDVTSASWEQRSAQLGLILPRLASELSPLAVVLAAVGGLRVLVKNARVGLLFFVVILTHIWLASGYTATTKTHIYLLPVTGLVAGLAAMGLWSLVEQLGRFARPAWRPVVALAVLAIAIWGQGETRAAYAAWIGQSTDPAAREIVIANLGPRPDDHAERRALDVARRVVAALPARALVYVDWGYMFTMQYVARFERNDRDLELHDPYPYGVGHREFPVDHVERIRDPRRDKPVYFVLASSPPPLPGFHLAVRARDVYELVRDGDLPAVP